MSEMADEPALTTTLRLTPLTSDAFKPFGAVIEPPPLPGERSFYSQWLGSARTGMEPRFHVNHVPATSLPYTVEVVERHPYAAQIFLPLDVTSYVIVVAPSALNGYPDAGRAQGFVASGTVGIVYAPGTWHAGITVLARPGTFGVLMWRNDTDDDEEFFPLASPLFIQL
jgi:ureidoglycolate lyase